MKFKITIASVALVMGLMMAAFIWAKAGDGPEPPALGCAEEFAVSSDTDGCHGVMGRGITYGPRSARRSIVVWKCEQETIIELTEHGPAGHPLDSVGPIISETVLPPGVAEFLIKELTQ